MYNSDASVYVLLWPLTKWNEQFIYYYTLFFCAIHLYIMYLEIHSTTDGFPFIYLFVESFALRLFVFFHNNRTSNILYTFSIAPYMDNGSHFVVIVSICRRNPSVYQNNNNCYRLSSLYQKRHVANEWIIFYIYIFGACKMNLAYSNAIGHDQLILFLIHNSPKQT